MQRRLRTDLNGLAAWITGDYPVAPSSFSLGSLNSAQHRRLTRHAVPMFRTSHAVQTNILHQTYLSPIARRRSHVLRRISRQPAHRASARRTLLSSVSIAQLVLLKIYAKDVPVPPKGTRL